MLGVLSEDDSSYLPQHCHLQEEMCSASARNHELEPKLWVHIASITNQRVRWTIILYLVWYERQTIVWILVLPACIAVQWFLHFQWTWHSSHPQLGNHDTMKADLWEFQPPVQRDHEHISPYLKKEQSLEIGVYELTLVGSRLTRPHARAATPVHPWEIAMIPMESGPGCPTKQNKKRKKKQQSLPQQNRTVNSDFRLFIHVGSVQVSLLFCLIESTLYQNRWRKKGGGSLIRNYLHPRHLDPLYSGSSCLWKKLC